MEGFLILAVSVLLYWQMHFGWLLFAILLLAPRTPAPPDPPHLDERDDDRRATEIMVPEAPPAFDPGARPGQAPVIP